MASDLKLRSEIPREEYRFLPQVGFGQDVTFDTIVTFSRFLFRVYTPKPSQIREDDSAFFVGSKFDKTYAPYTPISSDMYLPFGESLSETATYEDCINHLNWETRSNSPFISTSFNFAWAIWDAVRRYNHGIKHDVEIAVIDATAFTGKAVTVLQLLRKAHDTRHEKHGRWLRFAQESQSALVYGFIPRSAVLASIPLLSVLDRLPSYFIKPSASQGPLHVLSWKFDSKQSTYRDFCQEMADRFVRLPFQTRARDTAVGSVRLAITLLGSWFHEMVHKDLQKAVSKTRDLASVIAHWPEPSGSGESNEMGALIRSLIYLLAEEVRANHSCKMEAEVSRLQGVIDCLEEVVHDQEKLLSARVNEHTSNVTSSDQDKGPDEQEREEEPSLPELSEVLVSLPVSPLRGSLRITIPSSDTGSSSSSGSSPTSPRTPSTFSTPPSLHTTPSKSRFDAPLVNEPPSPVFSSQSSHSSPPHSPLLLPAVHLASPLTPLTLLQPSSPHEGSIDTSSSSAHSITADRERPSLAIPVLKPWTSLASATSPSAYFSALPSLPTGTEEIDSDMSEGCKAILGDLQKYLPPPKTPQADGPKLGSSEDEPSSVEVMTPKDQSEGKEILGRDGVDRSKDVKEELVHDDEEDEFELLRFEDLELDEDFDRPLVPEEGYRTSSSRPLVSDGVSCVVSGFLIGAFITLCILSSQRRTLITSLT